MPKPISFEIALPPAELWPNARPGQQRKACVAADYRAAVCARAMEATQASRPRWPAANIKAAFFFRDRRRRDPENLLASLEGVYAALIDAGVIADVSAITRMPPLQNHTTKKPCVLLRIEPLGRATRPRQGEVVRDRRHE